MQLKNAFKFFTLGKTLIRDNNDKDKMSCFNWSVSLMPYLMGSPGQSPAVFWPWPPTGWGQRERGSPVYNTKQKQIIQHKVKIGSTTQSKNRQYNTKQKQTIQHKAKTDNTTRSKKQTIQQTVRVQS